MEFFASPQSREASDASIDAWQAQFAERGWSNWAVEVLSSSMFIGFVGLSVPRRVLPFSPCVEVGWRLARPYWGQGYATEGARAALRVGFERLDLAEIVSFTSVRNLRSRAVMERIGMRNAHVDFEYPLFREPLVAAHCLYRIPRRSGARMRPDHRESCLATPGHLAARVADDVTASGEHELETRSVKIPSPSSATRSSSSSEQLRGRR